MLPTGWGRAGLVDFSLLAMRAVVDDSIAADVHGARFLAEKFNQVRERFARPTSAAPIVRAMIVEQHRARRRHHQLRAWLSAVLRVDCLRASRTARACGGVRRAQARTVRRGARRGSRLNGRPIRVSATPSLDRALLATAFPYDHRERRNFYLTFWEAFMMRTQGVRHTGSAVLDLCYVACGRVDALWEFGLRLWDVAAGALIVAEAGGRGDQSGRFNAGS